MEYKVGQRVKIKSLDWYEKNGDIHGNIECGDALMNIKKSQFCGKTVTISSISDVTDTYKIEEDKGQYIWTDEMIEGLAEEEIEKKLSDESWRYKNIFDHSQYPQSFECPDGYIFKDENGNIINAQKIVLEKKNLTREEKLDNAAQEYIDSDNAVLTYSDGFCEQTDHPFVRAAFKAGAEWADNDVTQGDCSKAPKLTSQDYSNGRFGYQLPAGFKAKLTERELILTPERSKSPKTYEECCRILGFDVQFCMKYLPHGTLSYKDTLIYNFQELLICRDAYWKIAGEEMGLGEPWKPQDTNTFGIFYDRLTGEIEKQDGYHGANSIFEFPTEEMRDAFYENFKVEIEICKELL